MKILRIYTKLPPLKGGMEKHIYNLTKLQIRDNHFVKVFFNDGEEISQNDEKICKLKLHRLKPQIIGFFIFYFLIVFKLLLKKQKFDIIHIHGDWSSLLFIKLLKKFTNAKLVVLSLHDQLTSKYNHQKLLPKLVQDVDLIFSTGYDTANELEKLSGKKVIVQPSGINEIFFQEFEKSFESKSFTVITVANLFPKKNIEFVLKIAQELKECRFVVVGEGTHREVLENIIQENKITNVELVGFKTPEQVREYYQKSDCYLLTSFAEGTPTSALEAMACGLPIVSSNAGGLGNIVKEKENGFIIDNFDKNKYIEKINFLKNNRNLIERIFKNNRCLSQNFKWINVAENITRNIEKVLNEKN